MYNPTLHQQVNTLVNKHGLDVAGKDNSFYLRLIANAGAIAELYQEIYVSHPAGEASFSLLIETIINAHQNRSAALTRRDELKAEQGNWFLSNKLAGMSLYVDRFCGDIKNLGNKLDYFEKLGVNVLHLLPVFKSPADESDGGYAVSDFRSVDERFGTTGDLIMLKKKMDEAGMYLTTDIVLNHTSQRHEWAEKAKGGDPVYQDYFYMFDDRIMPDVYEQQMPEIFPETSPGNFTYIPECGKWVMTVFHSYQWDLNYTNPRVLVEMLDNILFYANLGLDILRIDAPAFIWKQPGTTCQNLPQAHTLLRLIKQCTVTATPGMALLGEAIVAPAEIMKYFGTGRYTAHECDFAYNATHMALQWDALATGDTRVMLAAQPQLLEKPFGTSWITYTRCHDDIGLGYDDQMIRQAGFDPYSHRNYLKDYYNGSYPGSTATGALFSINPKTGDARISGTLASLCGLEKAIAEKDEAAITLAIQKILLMQAHSFFIGGLPMLFYGDELGYTNDYSYLNDSGKNYDNRWMHRPVIDWNKNLKTEVPGTIENRIFSATRRLLQIRSELPAIADIKNLTWLPSNNIHIAFYARTGYKNTFLGIFNFSNTVTHLLTQVPGEITKGIDKLNNHWTNKEIKPLLKQGHLSVQPYEFFLLS